MRINVADTSFTIAPGKTNELKVTVKPLHGFKARLALSAKFLPAGLTVEPAKVPKKGGEIPLKFLASPDSKPFSGLIQIVATETGSGKEHPAVVELTSSTVNNGVPGGFTKLVIESTHEIWLTVLPVPEPKVEKKE